MGIAGLRLGVGVIVLLASAVASASPRWTSGGLSARGAAAAELSAPSAAVARTGSLRAATARARAQLLVLAGELPLASGGTLADKMNAEPEVAARVGWAVARARVLEVTWSSDGGAQVVATLPFEALRVAVWPAPVRQAAAGQPHRLVVDARKAKLVPALGLQVASKGGSGQGAPIVWTSKPPPRGQGHLEVALAQAGTTRLELAMTEEALTAALAAGAAVVIIVREDKP